MARVPVCAHKLSSALTQFFRQACGRTHVTAAGSVQRGLDLRSLHNSPGLLDTTAGDGVATASGSAATDDPTTPDRSESSAAEERPSASAAAAPAGADAESSAESLAAAESPAEARGGAGSGDFKWDDLMRVWARSHEDYIVQQGKLQAEQSKRARWDNLDSSVEADGSVSYAADNMADPAPDSRVWLHMYESPNGLKPSFCERTGDAHYMYDFTGFQEWRVEQNALLSDQSKCLMYKLHAANPEFWDSALLARVFRIREQRALAIVKIKEMEFKQAEECVTKLNRLQQLFGRTLRPNLAELRKDKHKHTTRHLTAWFEPWLALYEDLPYLVDAAAPPAGESDNESAGESAESAGAPDAAAEDKRGRGDGKTLTEAEREEVVELHNFLAAAANREAKHVALHEDLWRCVYHFGSGERYVPMAATAPAFGELPPEHAGAFARGEVDHFLQRSAEAEDAREIAEFKLQLAWSLGEIGKSISRAPRKRGERFSELPRKPKDGWPILVQKLGPENRRLDAFVAEPSGERRQLTADEQLYLHHFKREPKFFSRPRRHAPFTNDSLHAFARKPNRRHDLYNLQLLGAARKLRPTSGPTFKQIRRSRMRRRQKAQELQAALRAR